MPASETERSDSNLYCHGPGTSTIPSDLVAVESSSFQPGLNDEAPAQRQQRRAAQACSRCRKQKLRCVGGFPCFRCVRAAADCNLSTRNPAVPNSSMNGAAMGEDGDNLGLVKARLEHVESSVAGLLAGMVAKNAVGTGSSPRPTAYTLPAATTATAPPPETRGPWSTAFESASLNGGLIHFPEQQISPRMQGQQVIGDSNPSHPAKDISPLSHFSLPKVTAPITASSSTRDGSKTRKEVGPEERLSLVTANGFEPPFRALVYQPSIWENREASRRSSPQPNVHPVHPKQKSVNLQDDPITSGLIEYSTAKILFAFYVNNCHIFLPVIDITSHDLCTSTRSHTALFCAILAISARFYTQHNNDPAIIDSDVTQTLADLAETHLAQTLLRKAHSLTDVQAILLLAAWGLKSSGKGPDAWILMGHAIRVARRLGLHRTVEYAEAASREQVIGSAASIDLSVRQQWKTWLSCISFGSFLSLGFGRPRCSHFGALDHKAFLKARISDHIPRPGTPASMSLSNDAYTAAIAQLADIAEALVTWTEKQGLAGDHDATSLVAMLTDLNEKLDDWYRLWVWPRSSHALYLGTSARIARLQAEHLRLSINALALRLTSLSEGSESSVLYIDKAVNAATTTIQTHFESSQADSTLSCATDYITISLAQAAVFLIRLTKASPSLQHGISLDLSVASHYITMSVDVLELGEKSETRLSAHLARTIRAISRAAGLTIRPDNPADSERFGAGMNVQLQVPDPFDTQNNSLDNAATLDFESLWTENDQFDFSSFLISSDTMTQGPDWLDQTFAY